MEKQQIKNEEEITYRIIGKWIKLQIIILSANGIVFFFILGYLGQLKEGVVFWALFTFFTF